MTQKTTAPTEAESVKQLIVSLKRGLTLCMKAIEAYERTERKRNLKVLDKDEAA